MMMKTKWRLWAPFILLASFINKPALADNVGLTPFNADYIVYRAGKKHGEANRYLTLSGQGYQLGYISDISWMIFSDKRKETSEFVIEDGQIKPQRYIMQRSGTGPDKYYELNIDYQNKVLTEGKKRQPKEVNWREDWQDQISYQLQLALDLKAGKTEFSYNVLNRNGNSKLYQYKVVAEETLPLPYGNVKTLRIARIEQNSDKQIYAWVAPELDYLLVRLWRGEENVEQFDVQLHKLEMQQASQEQASP